MNNEDSLRRHPAVAAALNDLLGALERDQLAAFGNNRRAALVRLCNRLEQMGLLDYDDYVPALLVMEDSGWPSESAGSAADHAKAVFDMKEPRLVADYLRSQIPKKDGSVRKPLSEFLPLALRIVAACAEGRGAALESHVED